jgi:hypothetical protein
MNEWNQTERMVKGCFADVGKGHFNLNTTSILQLSHIIFFICIILFVFIQLNHNWNRNLIKINYWNSKTSSIKFHQNFKRN